jgi:hypothetical protein
MRVLAKWLYCSMILTYLLLYIYTFYSSSTVLRKGVSIRRFHGMTRLFMMGRTRHAPLTGVSLLNLNCGVDNTFCLAHFINSLQCILGVGRKAVHTQCWNTMRYGPNVQIVHSFSGQKKMKMKSNNNHVVSFSVNRERASHSTTRWEIPRSRTQQHLPRDALDGLNIIVHISPTHVRWNFFQ